MIQLHRAIHSDIRVDVQVGELPNSVTPLLFAANEPAPANTPCNKHDSDERSQVSQDGENNLNQWAETEQTNCPANSQNNGEVDLRMCGEGDVDTP